MSRPVTLSVFTSAGSGERVWQVMYGGLPVTAEIGETAARALAAEHAAKLGSEVVYWDGDQGLMTDENGRALDPPQETEEVVRVFTDDDLNAEVERYGMSWGLSPVDDFDTFCRDSGAHFHEHGSVLKIGYSPMPTHADTERFVEILRTALGGAGE